MRADFIYSFTNAVWPKQYQDHGMDNDYIYTYGGMQQLIDTKTSTVIQLKHHWNLDMDE